MSCDTPSLAALTCTRLAIFLPSLDCFVPREAASFGFRCMHRRDHGFLPCLSHAALLAFGLASIRIVLVASFGCLLDLGRILLPSFEVLLARVSPVDAAIRRVRASRGRTSVSSVSRPRPRPVVLDPSNPKRSGSNPSISFSTGRVRTRVGSDSPRVLGFLRLEDVPDGLRFQVHI